MLPALLLAGTMSVAYLSLIALKMLLQIVHKTCLQVIQLQGDQRKNVSTFLVGNKICKKDQVKIHGF